MNNKNPDRRIQRTRRLLQDALVALMSETGYDQITVQDIIDRAGVSRSTFYAHYQDKEDLLLRGVAGIAPRTPEHAQAAGAAGRDACREAAQTVSMVGMFNHVKANGPLRKIMHRKRHENTLLEKGTAFLYDNVRDQLGQLKEAGREPAVPISLLALYLTGGLMSLVQWWTENGMTYSPQEMDALFQQIAMPGIRQVLGKTAPPEGASGQTLVEQSALKQ